MPRAVLSQWQRLRLRLLPRRRETLDAQLFLTINGLPHSPSGDRQLTLLSDLGKGIGWVAGCACLALGGGSRARWAALASVGAMFVGIAAVQGPLKHAFRRRRPFLRRLAIVVGPRPVDSSFPSGHTCGSFAAASALAVFYRRERPLLMGLAGGVGISRVYLGHHFPSDVLVGAGVGSVLGTVAGRWIRRLGGETAHRRQPRPGRATP